MANSRRSISTSNRGCNVGSEPQSEPPFGLLNLDKPIGLTSRDCVNRVVGRLRSQFPKPAKLPKVGHAGTLDPLASGVLIIGVGAGVRLVPYLHGLDKVYRAKFRFGESSQSGDLETEVVAAVDPRRPSREQVEAAALALTGQIDQVPPAHSAIKVGGRKAYKFAHRGQTVEVPVRTVRIEQIVVERYDYPEIELTIRCGTGTYIRTLGIDLAARCQSTAVMTSLVRTAIGDFRLADAVPLGEFDASGPTADAPAAWQRHLRPLATAVPHLTRLTLGDDAIAALCHGIKLADPVATAAATSHQSLDHPAPSPALPPAPSRSAAGDSDSAATTVEAAVIDRSGNLRAIVRRQGGRLHPYRVFPSP